MPSNLRVFSRDLLVWMIAFAAAAQSLSAALQGVLDGRLDHFLLHLATTACLVLLAISIERVKAFVGGLE